MNTGRAAASRKGVAARAEKNGKVQTVAFGKGAGITLKLPKRLDGDLIFEFAALENGKVGAAVNVLTQILGDEQIASVREQIRKDKVSLSAIDGVLGNLFNDIFETMGVAAGE